MKNMEAKSEERKVKNQSYRSCCVPFEGFALRSRDALPQTKESNFDSSLFTLHFSLKKKRAFYFSRLLTVLSYLTNSMSLAARVASVGSSLMALARAVAKLPASPVRAARMACR